MKKHTFVLFLLVFVLAMVGIGVVVAASYPPQLTVQGRITLNGNPVSGFAHLRCTDKTEAHAPLAADGSFRMAVPVSPGACTFFATDSHNYTSSTRLIPANTSGYRTYNDEIWWGGWPWNEWAWCQAPSTPSR